MPELSNTLFQQQKVASEPFPDRWHLKSFPIIILLVANTSNKWSFKCLFSSHIHVDVTVEVRGVICSLMTWYHADGRKRFSVDLSVNSCMCVCCMCFKCPTGMSHSIAALLITGSECFRVGAVIPPLHGNLSQTAA